MKVAIDVSRMHKLSLDRGIGIYAKNLYKSLKRYTDLEVDLIFEKPNYKKYDLVHFPYFDFFTNTLKTNLPLPVLVTVHDLIPIMFPKHYPAGIKGRINWQFQKSELKKVKSIITVSKTVKKDLEEFLKIDPTRISVVYSAPPENFKKINDKNTLEKVKRKYNLPEKFVLYIGNVNWNKNILNMTEGVLQASKNLVIIGSAFLDRTNLNHPEKKSFKNWIENYSQNRQIKILGSSPEEDVVRIMNLAECLIFVSYYEGFGLPILEAQACGTPVIVGDTSSMPEIAGEGAIEVTAPYPLDIVSGLRMVEQADYREKLIRAGFENLKRFSWKNTALNTMKVYRNALK